MRGNPYARGGDPMKSRATQRKEKRAKLAQTGRVKRLRSRLRGIRDRSDKREGNHHMTALMESYVARRKQERAAEKKKREEEEAKNEEPKGRGDQDQASAPAPQNDKTAATGRSKVQQQRPKESSTQRQKKQLPLSHRAPVSRGLY